MHTVRTCIGDIGKESAGQLTLDIEVPLLHISIFLYRVAGRRKVVLVQNVLRYVRLRIPSGYRSQVADVMTVLGDHPQVLMNRGGAQHWLTITLRGTRSNRDGFGARILVNGQTRFATSGGQLSMLE